MGLGLRLDERLSKQQRKLLAQAFEKMEGVSLAQGSDFVTSQRGNDRRKIIEGALQAAARSQSGSGKNA